LMLAATEFEFKQRFWIIGAIFFFAFLSYSLDHQNTGAAVVEWIARVRGTAASNTDYHLIFFVGALFAVVAAAIRTWATAYLNSEIMIAMRVQTSRLVADGPYRYLRNPLYFGNILWAIGFGLMASRVGFFILVVGMIVFCYRLILREEAGIVANQGDRYRAYCVAVPRLLPSLRPKLPPAGGVPNWADGLLGEAFVWVMAASEVAFAITLNQTVFFVIMGASFVVYAICLVVIKRRHKPLDPAAERNTRERPAKHAG
jgi:protein-S-isoprenylcysteine O-methyltransferase Ste14